MRNLQDFPAELLTLVCEHLGNDGLSRVRLVCRSFSEASWTKFRAVFNSRGVLLDSYSLDKQLAVTAHPHIAERVQSVRISILDFDVDWELDLTIWEKRRGMMAFKLGTILSRLRNLHHIELDLRHEDDRTVAQWTKVIGGDIMDPRQCWPEEIADMFFHVVLGALRMTRSFAITLTMSCSNETAIPLSFGMIQRGGMIPCSDDECVLFSSLKPLVNPNMHILQTWSYMTDDSVQQDVLRFFSTWVATEVLSVTISMPISEVNRHVERNLVHGILLSTSLTSLTLYSESLPWPVSKIIDFCKANRGVLRCLRLGWFEVCSDEAWKVRQMISLLCQLRGDMSALEHVNLGIAWQASSGDEEDITEDIEAYDEEMGAILGGAITDLEEKAESME